jgi:hypothetical protein
MAKRIDDGDTMRRDLNQLKADLVALTPMLPDAGSRQDDPPDMDL